MVFSLLLPLAFRWGTRRPAGLSPGFRRECAQKDSEGGKNLGVPALQEEAAGTAHRGPLCDRKSCVWKACLRVEGLNAAEVADLRPP